MSDSAATPSPQTEAEKQAMIETAIEHASRVPDFIECAIAKNWKKL